MKHKATPTRQNLRIILAITGKDILDALKNKTTLTALVTIVFLVVMYKFLPALSSDEIPFVFLYDAGHSTYTQAMEDSNRMNVRVYDSFAVFEERFRVHADAELGLVLPADFDQTLAAGDIPRIQGYVLHWVSAGKIEEQRLDLENRIAAIVGAPVKITMQGGTLTMLPESRGGFLASAGTVIVVMMLGMVLIPNLMLEEKTAKTLDALLVSPATSGQIVIAKALAGLFYGLVFIALAFALNASFILQWWLALLAVLLCTLISIALGLILGTLIENRQQLLLIANVIMFPLLLPVFLSLMTDLIPAWLISIMHWLPPVATSDLLLTSFSEQAILAQSLPRLGLLLTFVVALLGWETWLVRRADR
jgi:ABC-2 type transport system permease protein